MAQCFCRWRAVLICVCTPCIFLGLLLAYVTVVVCMSMNDSMTVVQGLGAIHFVASGTFHNNGFAPLPKTFWDLQQGDALWNRIQRTIDHHLNPILRPNNTLRGFENGTFYESLLKEAFSGVTDMERRRNQFPPLIQDFVSHMDRRDYPALLQPDQVCGAGAKDEKELPLLLLAIKSTGRNFKNRQAIRQTWGRAGWVAGLRPNSSDGGYVRRVFLLGKVNVDDVDPSELLQLESKRYGDILQWDFRDTFFNLTLKDVLFWSWFSQSCNETRFVFKGDDDVFVNTPKMMVYLRDQLQKPQVDKTIEDFMIGDVIPVATPNRINESKYFIPDSFYQGVYPMYAGGGGVVYSGLLTKRLHHMSKRVNLFPIDDVYVGMCMLRLNAHPVHHPAFLTFGFDDKEEKRPCSYHTVLLVHRRTPDQMVQLWAHVRKTQALCLDVVLRGGGHEELTNEGSPRR